jgi:DNA polymerase-3 subunit delta'
VLPATERHPHARAVLNGALPPEGRPSHAYLFHGPAGSGKATVARAFAAALLSDGAGDPDSVRARVDHGVHPDLTWVTPSGGAQMLVSDIDEPVVAAATRTPFEARRRVFVIERAETMNDQAANRMLKTLEEPAAFAHLVLLTDRPGEILPTIASRCQHVRFDAPSAEEIAARLAGIEPTIAQACARLGLGDAERAARLAFGDGPKLRAGAEAFARGALHDELAQRPWLEILVRAKALGDEAQAAIEQRIAEELDYLPTRDRKRAEREGAEAAKRAARRARAGALDQALQLAGLWFRDVAAVADDAPEVVHAVDRLDALREDAQGRGPHRLRAAVETVDDARALLILNPSEELLLEALAYRLARELRAS